MRSYVIFILIFIKFLPTEQISAEETSFVMDRRSFKSQPNDACLSIFVNRQLKNSSCSSIGFKAPNLSENQAESYVDYLYFFKVNSKDLIKNESINETLIITTYIKNDKILAIAPFRKIGRDDIITLETNKPINFKSQIETLTQEKNELSLELNNNNNEFQERLTQTVKSINTNQNLQKILKDLAHSKNSAFILNEIKAADERNRLLKADERNSKSSDLKAILSQMLKHTIESAIKSK